MLLRLRTATSHASLSTYTSFSKQTSQTSTSSKSLSYLTIHSTIQAKDLLNKTQKECSKLEARLRRMVTTGDQMHTNINSGSNVVDVIEGVPCLLKVDLKDK
jgi:methyl-accepting chemotaxis protein